MEFADAKIREQGVIFAIVVVSHIFLQFHPKNKYVQVLYHFVEMFLLY